MNVGPGALGGAAWLLAALLLKGAAILGIAWLLAGDTRRGSAAIRHGIWSAAFAALLALPLAGGWLPAFEVRLPAALSPAAVRAPTDPRVPSADAGFPASTSARPAAQPAASATREAPPRPRGAMAAGFDAAAIFLLLWLAGALLRALWVAAQMARARGLVRRATPLDPRIAATAAAVLSEAPPLRRTLRVLHSPHVSTPLTCGVGRPVILLPPAAAGWSEDRLRVVLLHEQAHIRRWDYPVCLAAEAACVLYWPLPLAWVARAGLHAEQEQASDDLVLAAGTQAVDYAEHLLAIARSLRAERAFPATTIGMAREVGLKRRIRVILDGGTARRPLRSPQGAATLGLIAAAALPIAALRPADGPRAGPAASFAAELPPSREAAELSFASAAAPDAYLWLEAEHGLRRGGASLREDLEASAGHFLALPPAADGAEAAFSLHVPRTDKYLIWARLAIESDRPASRATVALDSGAEVTLVPLADEADGAAWRWHRAADGASPVRVRLRAGIHTLRVASPAASARVDRLLVTTDAGFHPRGRGIAADQYVVEHRWLPVEPGPVASPLEYHVELTGSGPYVLWGRVLGTSGDANSFLLSVDGGPELIWDAPRRELNPEDARWIWDPASARDLDGRPVDPLILDLPPGAHTIRISPRERGTGLAALLLTNDLGYRPTGAPPGTPEVRIWLEPEEAGPVEALSFRSGGAATGEGYLEAAADGPRPAEPVADEAAALRFEVPQPGIYTLWGRVAARSDSEDSFWIRVNGGDWVRWNGIPRSRGWRWSPVHHGDEQTEPLEFALPAGENRIEIARREGGVRLDRLLITNAGFPAEPAPSAAE